jgi:diacylglycerol kinase family enzyme
LILSNSGILRGRDVLPRAHPNDGFVDVLEIDQEITLRQLALAWSRSKTGSHLPHPHFRVSRATEFQWSGSPSKMVADGVAYAGVVSLQCTVLADAMAIYF